MAVGPDNIAIAGAVLRWTCLNDDDSQIIAIDQQGLSWPTPECANVEVVTSALGYVTDTLILERPRMHRVWHHR